MLATLVKPEDKNITTSGDQERRRPSEYLQIIRTRAKKTRTRPRRRSEDREDAEKAKKTRRSPRRHGKDQEDAGIEPANQAGDTGIEPANRAGDTGIALANRAGDMGIAPTTGNQAKKMSDTNGGARY